MIPRLRTARILSLIVATGLILAACERPLTSSSDSEELPTPVVVTIESDTADEGAVSAEEPLSQDNEAEDDTTVEEAAEQEEEPEDETEGEQEDNAAEGSAEASEEEAEPNPAEETVADEDEALIEEDGAGEGTASEETADTEPIEDEPTGESDEDAEETSDETVEEESDHEELEVTDWITHTVAFGENLFRISVIYGVPIAEISQFNDIVNADAISIGQVLLIPTTETTDSETGINEGADSDSEENEEPIEPPSEFTDYTVLLGDTLTSIGLKFGVSWVEIAEANGIESPNEILSGQVLKIPVSTPGPSPEFTHVVRPGDSLRRISFIYGIPWLTIATANNILSPYFIHPGQSLVIPSG